MRKASSEQSLAREGEVTGSLAPSAAVESALLVVSREASCVKPAVSCSTVDGRKRESRRMAELAGDCAAWARVWRRGGRLGESVSMAVWQRSIRRVKRWGAWQHREQRRELSAAFRGESSGQEMAASASDLGRGRKRT